MVWIFMTVNDNGRLVNKYLLSPVEQLSYGKNRGKYNLQKLNRLKTNLQKSFLTINVS